MRVIIGEETAHDLRTDHVGVAGDDGGGQSEGVGEQLGVLIVVVVQVILEVREDGLRCSTGGVYKRHGKTARIGNVEIALNLEY